MRCRAAALRANRDAFAQMAREKEKNSVRLLLKATGQVKHGGNEAVNLKVAEQYVEAFGKLAKENNTLIMPANVADIGALVSAGLKIVEGNKMPAK